MDINQCIDDGFNGASGIAELQQTVNETCSFEEDDEVLEATTLTITTETATLIASAEARNCYDDDEEESKNTSSINNVNFSFVILSQILTLFCFTM